MFTIQLLQEGYMLIWGPDCCWTLPALTLSVMLPTVAQVSPSVTGMKTFRFPDAFFFFSNLSLWVQKKGKFRLSINLVKWFDYCSQVWWSTQLCHHLNPTTPTDPRAGAQFNAGFSKTHNVQGCCSNKTQKICLVVLIQARSLTYLVIISSIFF